MENQLQLNAIRKLAVAGEQAGFTLDQMIQLLNSGMSVVTLLDLIAWRLGPSRSSPSWGNLVARGLSDEQLCILPIAHKLRFTSR